MKDVKNTIGMLRELTSLAKIRDMDGVKVPTEILNNYLVVTEALVHMYENSNLSEEDYQNSLQKVKQQIQEEKEREAKSIKNSVNSPNPRLW